MNKNNIQINKQYFHKNIFCLIYIFDLKQTHNNQLIPSTYITEKNKDQIEQYINKIQQCLNTYSDNQQTLLLNYALKCKSLANDFFLNSQMDLIISEIQKLKPQTTIQTQTQQNIPIQSEKMNVQDLIRTKVSQSQSAIRPRIPDVQQNQIIEQNDAFIKDAEDQILKIYQGQKQSEINELNDQIMLMKEQLQQATKAIQEKDEQIASLQNQLAQQISENNQLQQQSEKLQKQVQQIQNQFYNVSQLCQQLQDQIFKQQEQNKQLKLENSLNASQQLYNKTQSPSNIIQQSNFDTIINNIQNQLQPLQFDKLTSQVINEAVQSLTSIKEVRDVMLQSIGLQDFNIKDQLNLIPYQSAVSIILALQAFVQDLDLDVKDQTKILIFNTQVPAFTAKITLNVLLNLI